jgi:hypothetical protein
MRRLPVAFLVGGLTLLPACSVPTSKAILTDTEMEKVTGSPQPDDEADPLTQTKSSAIQDSTTRFEGPMVPSAPVLPQQQPFPLLPR